LDHAQLGQRLEGGEKGERQPQHHGQIVYADVYTIVTKGREILVFHSERERISVDFVIIDSFLLRE